MASSESNEQSSSNSLPPLRQSASIGSLVGKRKCGVSKKIAQKFATNSHLVPVEGGHLCQSNSFTEFASFTKDIGDNRCNHFSTGSLTQVTPSGAAEAHLPAIRRNYESEENDSGTTSNSGKSYSDFEIISPLAPSSTGRDTSLDGTRSDCSGSIDPTLNPLPRISSQEARRGIMKTYLLLKNKKQTSVLHDTNELERCLPEGKVTIFVGTWNMAGQDIPLPVLTDWLIPEKVHTTADIYVIGVQEASNNQNGFKVWESKLQRCLWSCKQVLFHSYSLGVQHLAIFVRRELIWYLSRVSHSAKNTRIVSKAKTKGAISIGFKLFGTTFLFISSHLSYGPDPIGRIKDYHQVVDSLTWKNFGWRGSRVLENVDVAFWAGDLNFRLEGSRKDVEKLLERASTAIDYSALIERDQLRREISQGRLFNKFHEPEITFPPTYKYDLGKSIFDTSTKNRVPAYTDRILYRIKSATSEDSAAPIEVIAYDSVPSIKSSDHKPVYGIFRFKLKAGNDHMLTPKFNTAVLQAGLAHHHEEALKVGADNRPKRTTTSSSICCMM